MLSSNASSSSTKVLKCPHRKNDSISHTMVKKFIALHSLSTLTLTKMFTMYDFIHNFARVFYSILVSVHSR